MRKVIIYTDGACKENPGLGGWSSILYFQGYKKKIYGQYKVTTNNQMELVATINSIKYLNEPYNIKIITDSKYVHDGINRWVYIWKNKWVYYENNNVKNNKLWKRLYKVCQRNKHFINWFWIKGHNFNKYNIKIDHLARKAMQNE